MRVPHRPSDPRTPGGDGSPPDGLPAPRPYGHLAPEDGACLMETASVLAAGPFTDSPRGTDPALAALARSINDAVGEPARRRLRPLAADLAAARPAGRSYEASMIADVLHAAGDLPASCPAAARREARCRRRARHTGDARPGAFGRAADTLWWRGPGRHHLEYALRVLLAAPDAEDRLVRLLQAAVSHAVAAERSAPHAADTRTDTTADSRLP
ncbi:hypothetical protein [Streptomyces sp. TR06-5]|uniref:hypothetical protein n=1 Tax=Streptomyces sp. TR06-5 TaxID=3385976 RepID=UPI0039A3CDEC